MFKMSSHNPFKHLKHKLWSKEGSGVKLTIWLPTTKSQKLRQFPCVQVACDISLESSWQGLQLFFRPHLHQRFTHKLWAPKVTEVPIVRISGLQLGKPRTKWHLGVVPMAKQIVYYKGEGGGFPQVRVVVNLVSSWLPVVCPCTKVFQLRINQLVVWFVQVRVSKGISCQPS